MSKTLGIELLHEEINKNKTRLLNQDKLPYKHFVLICECCTKYMFILNQENYVLILLVYKHMRF